MTTEQNPIIADEDGTKGTFETLSQFVARVLNQLSLVAWLPSGALVLSLTFVFQLDAVLDSKVKPKDVGIAIGGAFAAMARIGFGGGLLLFAAVIVLTILTQAFAYGAILALQGAWSTLPIVELIAEHRCEHFRKKRAHIQDRLTKLTDQAWGIARKEIERQQQELNATDRSRDLDLLEWTPGILSYRGVRVVTGRTPDNELTAEERDCADAIPWEIYTQPDLLRRRENLLTRLSDFPESLRVRPTQLGNILAHYYDQIWKSRDNVETFALELYTTLPPQLRQLHDEERHRLDLYCSMVFVVAVITGITIAVLAPDHLLYAVSSIAIGAVAIGLMYRAAMATARIYGKYLLKIHRTFPST